MNITTEELLLSRFYRIMYESGFHNGRWAVIDYDPSIGVLLFAFRSDLGEMYDTISVWKFFSMTSHRLSHENFWNEWLQYKITLRNNLRKLL